jgi:predicted permease
MIHLRELLFRLQSLFRRRKIESGLSEEIESHLQLATEANIATGMSPHEARHAALREFGGVEQIKEHYRDQRGFRWADELHGDIRFAMRSLRKSPGFTAVAVLTLALGSGACTAIFSVVNGVLLRPLDYPEPERLVVLREQQLPGFREFSLSPPNYRDWEDELKSFERIAAYAGAALNLTGSGEPQRLNAVRATGHYFDVFRIRPTLGRTFLPDDDIPGKDKVVVLSHPFWQRVYGGEAGAVGRTLQLNGEPYTVIGIAPPGFGSANHAELWVPIAFRPRDLANENRGARFLNVVARLKPGVTIAQADAELKLLAARLANQYPETNKNWTAFTAALADFTVRDVRTVLYTLLGAVGCVLLIVCANIANLLLARAVARNREISLRAALGASRGRLIRQLLTESLLLALLGGVAGLLLAQWGLDALLALAPATLPRVADIQLDSTVLVGSLALSLLTGIAFGLAPAWLGARTDVNEALIQASRGHTDGRARSGLRNTLVVIEVALALVLLAGAGLLVRSFIALGRVDPGFAPEHAVVLRLSLPAQKYARPEQQVAFADALLARVGGVPGVKSAGIVHSFPLLFNFTQSFMVEGRPRPKDAELPTTNDYSATPGYFQAMGIRLVRGRLFTERDDANAPRVVLVNETLAREQFPNEDPIGKRINITRGPESWREIVGIVSDVKQRGLDKATPNETYLPFAQVPFTNQNLVVRANGSALAIAGALRPAVYAVDKDQPIGGITPLTEIMADSVARQRFAMTLLTLFAIVALVIAAVGIYGLMAYTVTRRTSEIGIRMALGAQRADVLGLVFAQGGRLVGLGLLLGLGTALLGTRLIDASILFKTDARDPFTFGTITLLLAVVATLACLLPALRATKVNPLLALRTE